MVCSKRNFSEDATQVSVNACANGMWQLNFMKLFLLFNEVRVRRVFIVLTALVSVKIKVRRS